MKSLGERIFFSNCASATPSPCSAFSRINAKDLGLRESWFRDAIFLQPELVIDPCRPTGRIPADERWMPWRTEINFGAGPVDVLLVSSHGRIGIVETKLSYNPQKRREVVAQILDYALALQELDVEDLPELPAGGDAPAEEDLRDALKAGRFLLLIAGDSLDSRALRLSQAVLASHLTSEWDLAMIDLNLYRSGPESESVVIVPELLGAVASDVRQVVRVQIEGGQSSAQVIVERAVADDDSPRRSIPARLESTSEFLEQLALDSPSSQSVAPALLEALQEAARQSGGSIAFGLARNSANLYYQPDTGVPRRMIAFRTNGRLRAIQRYLNASDHSGVALLLRDSLRSVITLDEDARSSGVFVDERNLEPICTALQKLSRALKAEHA
jgi:hypothetical protein